MGNGTDLLPCVCVLVISGRIVCRRDSVRTLPALSDVLSLHTARVQVTSLADVRIGRLVRWQDAWGAVVYGKRLPDDHARALLPPSHQLSSVFVRAFVFCSPLTYTITSVDIILCPWRIR